MPKYSVIDEAKPIPSYPGYSITKGERVWSDRSDKWLKTRVSENVGGYRIVNLRRDGKQHIVFVHRLLLETFVGPCPPGMECRHLDGNPRNNDLSNLAWGSRYENAVDRIEHGTLNRKLTGYQVSWIKQLLGLRRYTNRVFAKCFGVCDVTISQIKRGKIYTEVC